MSTISWQSDAIQTGARASRAGLLWALTCLVGGLFLLTEHSWNVSLAEAYTSNADQMEAEAGGGNLIRRVAFLSLAALGLTALVQTAARPWRPLSIAAVCVGIFVGWSGISLIWSDDPGMTFRRMFVLACFILGAVGLGRSLTGRELMQLTTRVAMFGLGIGLLAELSLGTFQPWDGDYRFSGTQHPNTTALSLAAVSIGAFCRWRAGGESRLSLTLFAFGFGFLILTKSRTSAAGVLAALLFLWTLSTPLRVKFGVVLGGAWAAGIFLIFVLLSGWDLEEDVSRVALMGREEQSESLTGRIPIWTELSPWLGRRFLTGYGYDSFWTPDHIDRVSRELQWGIREAHSAYFDLALSVGIPAALALLLGILLTMKRTAALYLSRRLPEHGFQLGLQLFCLINALTESAMVMPLFVPFIASCHLAQQLFQGDESTRAQAPQSLAGRMP